MAGATVAHYSGSGTIHPVTIRIDEAGTWGISWTFSCPAGRPGNFAVEDNSNRTPGKLAIDTSGKGGQGIWWDIR